MTSVTLHRKQGHIVSFSASDHTGYGVEGEDIVCAALSSVMQTAVLGLMRVASIPCRCSTDSEQGKLECVLPDKLTAKQRNDADMILETMLCGIADLVEGYSNFIKLEVK